MGPDVYPDLTGSPVIGINSLFRTPFNETSAWSLGPHLTNGISGGVTCTTCHTVHGTAPDPDSVSEPTGSLSLPPSSSFLAIAQSRDSIPGYSRPVPNGDGQYNTLCESCHGVDNNPGEALEAGTFQDTNHNVNPGARGTYSHPTDTYPSGYNTFATVQPENWPIGDPILAGAGVSYTLICETCHTPHPAAAQAAGRADVVPGAGAFILRAPLLKGDGT